MGKIHNLESRRNRPEGWREPLFSSQFRLRWNFVERVERDV
jgi:hypothetical protein